MYVMMCEIRKHNRRKTTLVSAHPIEAVNTKDEAEDWMLREPAIIVDHLNLVTEDIWRLVEYNKNYAKIWNKNNTIERTYLPKELKE